MSVRDNVQDAALLAARHAMPRLHAALVNWDDVPQAQPDPDVPTLALSTVSRKREGPRSIIETTNSAGLIVRGMAQRWLWNVQCTVQGWALDSCDDNNPLNFAQTFHIAWGLQSVAAALLGSNSAHRVKMVSEPGDFVEAKRPVRGHTLPVYVFEILFRYNQYDTDPQPVDVIETVDLTGTLTAGAEDVPVKIEGPPP